MKNLYLVGLVLLVGCTGSSVSKVAIFDGQTFNGWEGDTENWFRIEDGAIVAGSLDREIPQNEFLCTTRSYGDFTLTLKVKVEGDPATNAGIQFRTERLPDDNEVIGYQADIGPGYWGSLYDESRRNTLLATADSAQIARLITGLGNWHDYRIEAIGRGIRLSIDGEQTVYFSEPDSTIEQRGRICVQIHSGPVGEVHYKDIALEPNFWNCKGSDLPASPAFRDPNSRFHHLEPTRESRCRLQGS